MTETEAEQVTVIDALRAVMQEDFEDDLVVSSISIRVLQTGDVPYRLYKRNGEDYVGGVATASGR